MEKTAPGKWTVRKAAKGCADIVFFLAFAFCFSWEFINTTMFKKLFPDPFEERMEVYYHLAVVVILVCAVAAFLLEVNVKRSVVGAALSTALVTAGFLHWKGGGGKYGYFVLCVMVAGMTGRSFRALLTICISIGTAIMAAAFCASQAGIIEDLVYEGGRHSFGIVYCTDCAAHLLFLLLMYAMLRLEELGVVEYAAMVLVYMIMLMTKAQSDIVCGGLLLALIPVYRLVLRWKRGGGAAEGTLGGRVSKLLSRAAGALGTVSVFCFLLCAAASFVVTLGFNRDDQALRKKLPYSLIRRLEMNKEALRANPFPLLGAKIEEHGFGGRTKNLPGWDKYFFLDCSYIRLYVIGGVLLFLLILLFMTCVMLRCRAARRYGYLLVLAIVAASCLMEHHLMEYHYNIFPLMAFSSSGFFRRRIITGGA